MRPPQLSVAEVGSESISRRSRATLAVLCCAKALRVLNGRRVCRVLCRRRLASRRSRSRQPWPHALARYARAVLGACGLLSAWLENTARSATPHWPKTDIRSPSAPGQSSRQGRLVMFADGCVWTSLTNWQRELSAVGINSTQDWEWSAIPSVTASANPPHLYRRRGRGGEANDEFVRALFRLANS